MRMYQHIGLTGEAVLWLSENCEKEDFDPCPHCGKMTKKQLKVVHEKRENMFYGDGPTLHTYLTKSRRKVREIVQASPWSSGPMGFLCLELEDESGEKIRISEWTEKEIDNYSH